MARVYKYKTLRGLLAHHAGQMTVENLFNNRRIYKSGRGWCSFELSEEATREAAEMLRSICIANAQSATRWPTLWRVVTVISRCFNAFILVTQKNTGYIVAIL
jgi:hypothetical protein